MSFRVTVEEIFPGPEGSDSTELIKRFEQVVDQIDLPKVFAAINTPPRKKRERKPKAGTQ